MIAIPNAEIPDDAVNVELTLRDEDGYIVWHMFDLPLIEIDEDEMEYLYKEFGLEKDENLTDRAKELKRAILMGYLYAKREIVQCKACKYSKIYSLQSDAPMKRWCHKGHFPKEVTDGYYCGDGKRSNADQRIQRIESVGERRTDERITE